MKLRFVGHACFVCESQQGIRVLLDPYKPGAFGGRIALRPFSEQVHILASTHNHHDHFHIDSAFGSPFIVRWPGVEDSSSTMLGTKEVLGVVFTGLRLPHGGDEKMHVVGLLVEMDGVAVFHPGDLGRPLEPAELALLGKVDVLLLPVGGTFTIGPEEAVVLMQQVRPAIAIPMHYRMQDVIDLRLRPLDDFLRIVGAYKRVAEQPVFIVKERLPQATEVWVLEPTHAVAAPKPK